MASEIKEDEVLVGVSRVGVRIFNGVSGLQHGVGFASTSDELIGMFSVNFKTLPPPIHQNIGKNNNLTKILDHENRIVYKLLQ